MEEKMEFIDTHAHLDDAQFDPDRDRVIERAKEAGLKSVITVACWDREKGFAKAEGLLDKYPMLRLAAGVHPHDAEKVKGSGPFDAIRRLADARKAVAIGETGLDYHYTNSPKDTQRDVFIKHIKLAREKGLPLIIHSREAEAQTIEILVGEGAEEAGGTIHCFSGTEKMAGEALKMGFYLSFTGIVTFPKAEAIREVIKNAAMERMLIETDSPYLAPVPYRGKRCEPSYVAETARKIAEIKGIGIADVARITTLNAETLFGLSGEGGPEAKIAYQIRNSLYLNITNRCTNYCTFCAKFDSYTVKGHYLKLKREPDFMDIVKAAGPEPTKYDEIVFCGFGEPLIRLDLVKKAGMYFKRMGCKIRIDTDGLANLVHKKNVLSELMFVDCISVSLNAPDSLTYQKLCKTPFGDDAYPAILFFLREAKKFIPKVVATVVAVPGLDAEACRKVAEDEIGVGFRVREYDEVG
ncbi:MAG: YchF/TatD family DNA exonuclease [Deltaproteobacteria bacterium]|nr:YchF/TatD family DNA exonuclease [Deltaproteobacteria bacterium]